MADVDQIVTDPALIQQITKGVTSEALTPENASKLGAMGQDMIVGSFKTLFAGLTILLGEIAGPVVEGIVEGQQSSSGSYNRVAARIINGMLNAGINTSDMGAFGGNAAAAQKIGAAMFKAFGAATAPLEPSDTNAKQFVGTVANMTVESWMTGFIFEILGEAETCGFLKFEQMGELGQQLQDALGLPRLTRRLFSPYFDAVCATPFKWQVNKTYRPELLSPAQAAKQVIRGRKTPERFYEETARVGLEDADAEAILNSATNKLSIDDWLFLDRYAPAVKPTVDASLRDLGCDVAVITQLRLLDKTRRERKYLEATAAAVIDAYLDGHASDADLNEIVGAVYPDPDERTLVINLTMAKRAARAKRIPKGDIEEAVKRGLLSPIDYRAWLRAEGYDDESSIAMELLLQSEIRGQEAADAAKAKIARDKQAAADAKAADDARRRDELEARNAAQIPPLGDIKAAAIRGIVPLDRYTTSLQARGYAPADVAFLTTMLQADRDERIHADEVRAAADAHAAAAQLSLGEIERAVLAGFIAVPEYDRRLTVAGYDAADRTVLVALLTAKLDEQRRAEQAKRDAAAALTKKGLNLAQADRATRIGVWTAAQYRAWLTSAGLDDVAVATLAATMDAELATDAAAEARRAEIAQELAVKSISLPQLEAAVLRGLTSIETYRQTLLREKYSTEDTDLLVELLQARVDDAAAAQALHDAAAAAANTKRVTLSQIERAVVLGIVTLDDYDGYLVDLGYGDDDRAVLHGNLVAAIQAARAVDDTRAAVDAGNPADQEALSALEAAVLAGDRTMDDYRTALSMRELSAAHVDALIERLQDKLDNTTDAERLAGIVDAELKRKQFSIAQWHDAIGSDLRSLEDYGVFLAQQGYAPADVDILVTLLNEQLTREAAKAK